MKPRLSGISIFITLSILSTSLSCSKELSRSKAADLIRQTAEYKVGMQIELKEGLDCKNPGNTPVPEVEKQYAQEYEWLKRRGYLTAFEILPLKAFISQCPNWSLEFSEPGFRLHLSEQAKSSLPKGTHANVYLLTIANKQIVDVTGIASAQAAASESLRQVEFTWKWVPNDVGRELVKDVLPDEQQVWDQTNKGRASLQLYDDGFRVTEVNF